MPNKAQQVDLPKPPPDNRVPYKIQPVDLGQTRYRTSMTVMPNPGEGINSVPVEDLSPSKPLPEKQFDDEEEASPMSKKVGKKLLGQKHSRASIAPTKRVARKKA